jgi:hypothetical protein
MPWTRPVIEVWDIMVTLTQGLSEKWARRCDESSIDSNCGKSEGGSARVVDGAKQQKKKEERRGFLRPWVCNHVWDPSQCERGIFPPHTRSTFNDASR